MCPPKRSARISMGASVVQSSENAPFTSGFNAHYGHMIFYVKRVSRRSAESRAFSTGTLVSSHRECWQGRLGLSPN